MPTKIWFGLLAAVLLLSACAGSQTELTSTPQVARLEPTATLADSAQRATLLPSPTSPPTLASTPTDDLPPVPSGCTVVSQQYSPQPTEQSIFPPVTSTDWSIGPEDAVVTLVEYGDFQ